MEQNPTYEKALLFAIRIVKVYKYLTEEKREFIISKQLLRCGTSVGANISEALSAESSSDFIHKLAISQKETNETIYWLTILEKTDYLSRSQFDSLYCDCQELRKILVSIILTSKRKLHKS